MKKVFRKIFLSLMISCTVNTLFALDFGGVLSNVTEVNPTKDNFFNLEQQNNLSVWIKSPLGESGDNYFIAEGLYRFTYKKDFYTLNYIDLSLLKFVLNKEVGDNKFSANIGRFVYSDITSYIFTQATDGAELSYSGSFFDCSFLLSYTGLLNENIVQMNYSPDYREKIDSVYSFSDKFLVSSLTFSLPAFIKNNSLAVQGIGSIRIDDLAYNRFYFILSLNGAISDNLFYGLNGVAFASSYAKEDFKFSPFGYAYLNFFYEKLYVNANVIYAGEDFIGISRLPALNSAYEPEYSGLLVPGLVVSYKIDDNIRLFGDAKVAFDNTNNFELKGFQYKLGLDYQVLTDFYVGLKWLQYFDINKSDKDLNSLILSASISF